MIESIFETTQGMTLFFISLLWTLPWKGYALWKAARRKESGWFILLFLVNTLAILEIIYIFWVAKEQKRRVKKVVKWWKKRK
tara:strand:- start:956 stop:1201 length:246 start_codon:yes stop_codon:yes gene_type:complete